MILANQRKTWFSPEKLLCDETNIRKPLNTQKLDNVKRVVWHFNTYIWLQFILMVFIMVLYLSFFSLIAYITIKHCHKNGWYWYSYMIAVREIPLKSFENPHKLRKLLCKPKNKLQLVIRVLTGSIRYPKSKWRVPPIKPNGVHRRIVPPRHGKWEEKEYEIRYGKGSQISVKVTKIQRKTWAMLKKSMKHF